MEASDVGEPFGLIPGPSCAPLGATPVSPFGETPGPKGMPFGAVGVADGSPSVFLRICRVFHNSQWVSSSSRPMYGQGGGVVEPSGEPLGLIPGPRGTPLGEVPVSPFGETPGPNGTPLGAKAVG